MNRQVFNSTKITKNPLIALTAITLAIGLGVIGLSRIIRPYQARQRAYLYDQATNVLSTNSIPGLLLKGDYKKARDAYEDVWNRINENLRDTTAPSIFTELELSYFKARFGSWEYFSTNYINKEAVELENLTNERIYNLSK